jgi:Protein of unknown function (DUF1549)/Protein of unknown function (DUF1553)
MTRRSPVLIVLLTIFTPWFIVFQMRVSSASESSEPSETWAFKPVKHIAVPQVRVACSTPIDAFIFQKLEQAGLASAPPPARLQLIRRVTYDLTGLPPTPEEVDAFLRDSSGAAFDKVVERLLASPRYGEQWGRHWLDVVRYADTDGYSNDYERPNAWRYRDYVIRSLNQDKPYDQFIIEQLAGDELEAGSQENLIATGFLRMGPWEQTSMSVAAATRQQFLDDATQTTATTFLALTARCASCHDHKFDPIPTRDYYRLQAVFAPVQFEQRPASFLPAENVARFDSAVTLVKQRIEENERRRKALEAGAHALLLKRYGVSHINELPREVVRDGVADEVGEQIRALRKRIEYYQRELQRYQPLSLSVSSGGAGKKIPTPDTHILIGGGLESPGDKVLPAVFSAAQGAEVTIPQTTEGRRLALARWIASPSNPLTARVMVNRIWQHHFGRGLVKTGNNFGKTGERPTHPELLDWLARYFVEHGWSIKAMHRLIVKSAVYQRSAAHPEIDRLRQIDPENKLLSHFSPRRLAAEELRDSILAAAGALNLEAGGPGVFPEINRDLALQPRQIMGTIAPAYEPAPTKAQRNRRTIYTFQQRNLPNPLLEVFNGPNLNESCERRDASVAAPQVFALFNSQFLNDAALEMARNVDCGFRTADCGLKEDKAIGKSSSRSPNAAIERAFLMAFQRRPAPHEMTRCLEHLERMNRYHAAVPPREETAPKRIVRSIIGELTGKQFDFEEDWDPAAYEFNLKPSQVTAGVRALAELCLVLLNSNEFAYVY